MKSVDHHQYPNYLTLLLCIACIMFGFTTQAKAILITSVKPQQLKCESIENPQGIDILNPSLSWTIQSQANRRGVLQTAYRIIVSTSKENLAKNIGDVWDSGQVRSAQMNNIHYAGKILKSTSFYWWKVKIWDEKGNPSNYSMPARWITGLLGDAPIQAKWISAKGAEKFAHQYQSAKSDFNLKRDLPEYRMYGPKPSDPNFSSVLLRKSFVVKPKIKSAIIHISGLGQYELTVNGQKIGKDILSPGWSDYTKTILYDTFDITAQFKNGENAIGIILSNGMYNIQPDSVRYVKFLVSYGQLKAIASIHLQYADGSAEVIVTDQSWQVSPGPVTYSNLFGGEDYDERLAQQGWDEPNFIPKTKWAAAETCSTPGGKLKGLSCAAAPIMAIENLTPIKATQLSAHKWVYDLGQNASIMPEIMIKGNAGSMVRITPAELLKPDGHVDRASVTQDGIRPAWWQYTMGSSKVEKWFPKFFYQGARYLEVELFPAEGDSQYPVLEELKGVVVHSSAAPIGSFSSSNELFNRIYSLVRWAQRSNMMSVMTDCPHREKQGWLEQYHLNGPSLRYNFDLTPMFRKIMNDMSDSQLDNGLVPNIAPEFFMAGADIINNGFRNSPEWGSSFIIVPWQQYLFNGDVSLVRNYYAKMQKYLAFLDASAKKNLLHSGLGDWYDIGPKPAWGSQLTPISFTASAIYFYDYQLMGKMAALIGKPEEAKTYLNKSEMIRKAFNDEFFNPVTNTYATGSNTTYAMPLFLKIAAPQHREALIKNLVSDIRKAGNSFNSGEVGYRFLLGALDREGYSDVIYDMNNQSDRPGYGYQLKMGATALTEKWDASVGSFGSQNHFMSGQINEWFFHGLAGISEDENGPGFRKMIIKPTVTGDLKWVKGSYKSVSGEIKSYWLRNGNKLSLDLQIPANTEATVYVPATNPDLVMEGSKKAIQVPGIKWIKYEAPYAVYHVGSGVYHFKSEIK
ncbi:alpha-L-rhamnosidase-like protein [Pedobacter psychrotolerans]|uniref:alpha-L-rhamnosidase n=2 Tax=Pedobacter psychrotolerans TaxID=1843235 RepID=A0A4R2HIM5_9SPHI|nr:family 78 glycoside hydrolase catalytic domain [Pedobacter psychrotolerans]TCO28847.1 alpha-L-rhamnosidase-like protein [Pedobacter psychrotolerans]